MKQFIPFNKPPFVDREIDYVTDAIKGGYTSGDGPFTRICAPLMEEITGAKRVLMTTSCTHALEMSAILLNIGPGDEVIIPSFTFVSTVNAFVLRGATPIFADVRPDTLNLDETALPDLLTDRTRAIVPVHYAGVGCEMDTIGELAAEHGIPVVEDNAHGFMGRYKDKPLGTFGVFATQSFHQTKNFSCGEGGALLVNDTQHIERAEILREKGTNRSKFFRGEIDKYTWVDVGSSYLPSDILIGALLAQLEQRESIQARRGAIWQRYHAELAGWASSNGIGTPTVPAYCEQTYHMYYLMMPDLPTRTRFIAHMRTLGVLTVFHYQPLHLSDMGLKFGGKPGQCPVTERAADVLVRLPLFYALTDDEQDQVVEAILEFRS